MTKQKNRYFTKNTKNEKSKKDKKLFKSTGKRGRLIIRNIPYSVTKDQLENYFATFGKITEVNIPYHEGSSKPKGFAFINFVSRLSADKATEELSGKEFMGRKLSIERAVDKNRFIANNAVAENGLIRQDFVENDKKNENSFTQSDETEIKTEIKQENGYDDLDNEEDGSDEETEKVVGSRDVNADSSPNEHKSPEDGETFPDRIPKKKKARLIIRNLSFKSTENKLAEHFKRFGEIIDLQLLRRVDNKLVGCGFVEFKEKKNAVKAILETSGKPFLGRPIIVDWAIPAKEFRKVNKKNSKHSDSSDKVKEEVLNDDETGGGKLEENGENIDDSEDDVKPLIKKESSSEDESDDSSEEDSPKVEENSDNDDDDDDDDEEEEDDEDSDDVDDSDDKSFLENKLSTDLERKPPKLEEPPAKKSRFESHDVEEGRTVFIKNVPFSATKDELAKCVRRLFGPIFYALICVDPLTEHSRGTAFVKFQRKEDADKCLAAATEFTLNGTVLDPHPAIDRKVLKDKIDKDKEKIRDARNLYLIKEGVVLAGTPAASGVSATDMALRLELEQWKGEMLKNLNMFVSRNRLLVHNLPASYNDTKLRSLFQQHSRKGAKIKEARVMRDLKNVDGKGVGLSREYGFVTFEDYNDALTALRNINNNPKIFTENKRPIVSFSIENRRILNMRQKRLARSRVHNPLSKNFNPATKAHSNARGEEQHQRLGQAPRDENGGKREKFVGKNKKHAAKQQENKEGKNVNKMVGKFNNQAKNRREKGGKFVGNRGNKGDSESNKSMVDGEYQGVSAKPGKTKVRAKFKLKKQAQTHAASLKKKSKVQKEMKKKEMLKRNPIKQKNPTSKKKIENDAHFNSLINKYKTQLQTSKKWFE